jgi:glycosyltransferase involved in cell wall biosynthesis
MIVVSYYTNEKYRKASEVLAQSLDALKIRHDISEVKDRGSWQLNTLEKAPFLQRMLIKHQDEDAVLWLDANAIVRRPLSLFKKPKFDVAVYRFIQSDLVSSGKWTNFGRLWNGTLYLKNCELSRTIVDRWFEMNLAHPDRTDQKNLAAVMVDVTQDQESRFYRLPAEYCWIDRVMRVLLPDAAPAIEHPDAGLTEVEVRPMKQPIPNKGPLPNPPNPFPPEAEAPARDLSPGVVWSGHCYDYSGYAKANREFLFRVGNSMRAQLSRAGISDELRLVDPYTRERLDAHARTAVGDKAPFVRMYTPRDESQTKNEHRISFTMMETEQRVHEEFVGLLNRNYSEVLVPTQWNRGTLVASGLKIPCNVVPLGVDPNVYRPHDVRDRTTARLLTTDKAGLEERPPAYGFLSVFQPTFRKGIDVIVKAFERAFGGASDSASLTLYTGIHKNLFGGSCDPFRGADPSSFKSRIYHATGRRDEFEMSKLYNGFDSYVTASRGEGWNLPLVEAAACGLVAIAPLSTSHLDIFEGGTTKDALFFKPTGFVEIAGSASVCRWYDGQVFADYGEDSIEELAQAMRTATSYFRGSALNCSHRIRETFNWDRVAARVTRHLLEIQGV